MFDQAIHFSEPLRAALLKLENFQKIFRRRRRGHLGGGFGVGWRRLCQAHDATADDGDYEQCLRLRGESHIRQLAGSYQTCRKLSAERYEVAGNAPPRL